MSGLHIHLDPVGGIAGDMFVAALLDTWPDLEGQVTAAVRSAGLDPAVCLSIDGHSDGTLTGRRFHVEAPPAGKSHGHSHTHWSQIRSMLLDSALPDRVTTHAIGIFQELAQAEAQVHGEDVNDVVFHEVGNWDSIADIVAAAALIDALGAKTWSIGSLPIGRGTVKTAHGDLPVPAPATVLLLEGFDFRDDGRSGERVTPTGAAILRYLMPAPGIGALPRTLHGTGFGFGTKTFDGMSNVLRVLAFDTRPLAQEDTDTIAVLQFEIDDQTGEDLAVALEAIRGTEGVIDVSQSAVQGKKNRMMASIQVLAHAHAVDQVCEACFRQTTTLGIRTRIETRRILNRREVPAAHGRVKIANRPGGRTAKTDIDDVAEPGNDHRTRAALRAASEQEALGSDD
ncbi:MAG: LarC family nickel insertion protein [Pseudomonadota bacterium]